MATTLHQTLIQRADNKVAFVFNGNLLSEMLLREFKNSYKQSLNKSFPIDGLTYPDGKQKLQAKLIDVKPNVSVPAQDFFRTEVLIDPTISKNPIIKINDTFSISLEIHKAIDPTKPAEPYKVLFSLTYEVSLFNSAIYVSKGELELNNQIDFSVNHISIDSPNIDDLKIECEISDEQLLSLKGTLFYILPKKIISSHFLGLGNIKLNDIFTPFSSLGDFNVELVNDNGETYTLLILKQDISLDQVLGCGINLGNIAPTFELKQNGWKVNYIPFNLNNIYEDNGIIMTYIPKILFEKRFDKVSPAVNYTDSDNGFIGWDINVVVSLKYVGVKFDTNRKCIIITLELYIWGSGHLTIDLGPCIGRMNLGDFEFHIGGLYGNENSTFDIVMGLDFEESTNLYLKSNIENVQMGETRVTLELVSKYAGMAGGKAAIAGFIIDAVLARILQHNIPIEIRHIIEKQGNLSNIKVMDLSKIEKIFKSKVRITEQSGYLTEKEDKSYVVNLDKLTEVGRLSGICSSYDTNSILFGVRGYSKD